MGELSENTRGLLVKTYPLSKKETIANEPEWALKLGNGDRKKEIYELGYAHKKEAPYRKKYRKGTRNESSTQTPAPT